jgi:hypothetical protein
MIQKRILLFGFKIKKTKKIWYNKLIIILKNRKFVLNDHLKEIFFNKFFLNEKFLHSKNTKNNIITNENNFFRNLFRFNFNFCLKLKSNFSQLQKKIKYIKSSSLKKEKRFFTHQKLLDFVQKSLPVEIAPRNNYVFLNKIFNKQIKSNIEI